MTLGRLLLNIAVPAVVLTAAWLLAPRLDQLPPSLAGLKEYGIYAMLGLGLAVSLAFRRGRVVIALLVLALAYVSYAPLANEALVTFRASTVFAALCVFVPLNFAALCLLPERGLFNMHGLRRLSVIALEVIFTWWSVFAVNTGITEWAYEPLHATELFAASPIPQIGLAAIALAHATMVAAWLIRRAPIDLAFAAAALAFGFAMHASAAPHVFAVFTGAGALMFTVAVLQDTFRMAFRDELTGLASRRDLNERMLELGNRYAIAMLDVDHFKKFNDTYGHDLGDQVLKMVAMKIAEVGGGGKAFRYGGEEFAVLFPGRDINSALPHLEALRGAVEGYSLALRATDRPPAAKKTLRHRGAYRAAKSVSVTISIGVAERTDQLAAPADVMRAADKALYRAKRLGRNQVSK